MPQRHLDRLSALGRRRSCTSRAPSRTCTSARSRSARARRPTLDELLAHIASRLDLVPRYRQRLAHTPLDRGRPLWVDDPHFSVEEHVRHTALPAPGGRGELLELVARVFSTQLDRSRPLWELWFVEGLAEGGFALIFKSHHALIDGVAGVDLATVVFDLDAAPHRRSRRRRSPWQPGAEPRHARAASRSRAAGVARGGDHARRPRARGRARPDGARAARARGRRRASARSSGRRSTPRRGRR